MCVYLSQTFQQHIVPFIHRSKNISSVCMFVCVCVSDSPTFGFVLFLCTLCFVYTSCIYKPSSECMCVVVVGVWNTPPVLGLLLLTPL